jgi:hypothetical protein
LFVKDNVKYYITEKVDSSNYFDRVDLFYEENGALLECENNPVKRDIDNARGAGKIFKFDGKLIRPAQNCGNSYGEKLNFNEVVNITKHSFEEKPLCDISVKSIALNKSNVYTGIHTYNKVANVEVIDLKLPRKFNFYNFIGSFVKLFKKIF